MQQKAASALVLSDTGQRDKHSKSIFAELKRRQRDEKMNVTSCIPSHVECYLQSRCKTQSQIAAVGICWDQGQCASWPNCRVVQSLSFYFFFFEKGWCLVSTPEASVVWQRSVTACLYRLPKSIQAPMPPAHTGYQPTFVVFSTEPSPDGQMSCFLRSTSEWLDFSSPVT